MGPKELLPLPLIMELRIMKMAGWMLVFYGINTPVGYLMPNSVFTIFKGIID